MFGKVTFLKKDMYYENTLDSIRKNCLNDKRILLSIFFNIICINYNIFVCISTGSRMY